MAYFTAVLDANVLFPPPLRDLLIRLAIRGLYHSKWTNTIHAEWMEAVLKRRPNIERKQLERTRQLMDIALEGALVENYETLIPNLTLPDSNDRHVLAAAIKGEANIIITLNLKDFPAKALAPHHIQALHPDTLIYRLLELDMASVLAAMRIQRTSLKNPPKTPEEYLRSLEKQGLTRTVGMIKEVKNLI